MSLTRPILNVPDTQSLPAGPEVGDLLAGKYRVERKIGQGGMGVVVVARHVELDERVAVKFLLPKALEDNEAVMRFSREARASVKIKSEHVVRTLDVGKLDNGAPYMVMEYLEGADLGARLEQSGRLPIKQAVDFVLQTCHALADAHAIGIIHRDIKPSNLFVVRKSDGTEAVKVLDFGISKVTGSAAGSLDVGMTSTRTLMGSPSYMSPEQLTAARDAGVHTDIWALGITLHEFLAGHPPFAGPNMPVLCTRIMQQAAPRLSATRPDVPDELQSVVDKCLEKEPAKRYPNVAELAVALVPFASSRGRRTADAAQRVLQAAGLCPGSLTLPLDSNSPPVAVPVRPYPMLPEVVSTLPVSPKRRPWQAVRWGVVSLLLVAGAIAAIPSATRWYAKLTAPAASAAATSAAAPAATNLPTFQFVLAPDATSTARPNAVSKSSAAHKPVRQKSALTSQKP